MGVNFIGTPLKRRCGEMVEEDAEKSILESVPRDILIRILCGVDHDDLKQLFHVSSTIRDAVKLLVILLMLHTTLLLLLLHTAAAVPHAYNFSSLLIIFAAAAHHPHCSCHLHHFTCCCWIDIHITCSTSLHFYLRIDIFSIFGGGQLQPITSKFIFKLLFTSPNIIKTGRMVRVRLVEVHVSWPGKHPQL